MTKIYEALELADQELAGITRETAKAKPAEDARSSIEETMIGLYQSINSLLADARGKAVLFIGSRRGEGTSTLARELAKAVAFRLDKSVLLLDADQRNPTHARFFSVTPHVGWDEVVRNSKPLNEALNQVGWTRLFISQASMNGSPTTGVADPKRMKALLQSLKDDFDLILIDSPPATISADSVVLSGPVDGVVLVVEAEATRYEVAQEVVQWITTHGGNILGVILNKRRYPIPKWIYKRI